MVLGRGPVDEPHRFRGIRAPGLWSDPVAGGRFDQVTVKTNAWVTVCRALPLPNSASMVRW